MFDARGNVNRAAIRGDVQMFKGMLQRNFGNLVAGWRGALDADGSGSVDRAEFIAACRSMQFPGNAHAVFDALADGEELSLHALDKESAELLSDFAVFIRSEFGTVDEAFTSGLGWASRKTKGIDLPTFLQSCLEMRFRSQNFKRLFDCLDYDLSGELTLEELRFLEIWKADMFRPPPTFDEQLAEALKRHTPVDEICTLVEQGARPNKERHHHGDAFTDDGNNALSQAVERGTDEHVRRLLARGADPRQANIYGRTPLHAAAARPFGRVDPVLIIQHLAAAQADPNTSTGDGTTPLHVACAAGHAPAVARLAYVGANVHALDCMNRSPLWFSVFRKSPPCCEALLEMLADPCRHAKSGRTVMQYAIETRQVTFIKMFRAHVQDNYEYLVKAAARDLGDFFEEMPYIEMLPDVARLKDTLKVGERVEAEDSEGLWWPVCVSGINADGTYAVNLQDHHGTVWSRVYASNMRRRKVIPVADASTLAEKGEARVRFQRSGPEQATGRQLRSMPGVAVPKKVTTKERKWLT